MAVATSGSPRRGLEGILRIGCFVLRIAVASLPNALTMLRLAAAVPVAVLLWRDDFATALAVLVVAVLTDGLDGSLARLSKSCTRLGALLDPLADKLLIAAVLLGLLDEGLIPFWLIALVLGRDLLLVAGTTLLMRNGKPERTGRMIEPLLFGKVTTAAQMGLALLAVAALAGVSMAGTLLAYGVVLVAGLTLLSLGAYVRSYAWLPRPA